MLIVQKRRGRRKREIFRIAGKCTLLVICIGLAICGVFYAWSISAALPETFTELYFENPAQLPSKVIPHQQYVFQFTLHNLEDKDMEYSYEVDAEVAPGMFVAFDKGTIFVKKNEYKTIREAFVTASAFPKHEIIVNLINKKQAIDFWIEGDK